MKKSNCSIAAMESLRESYNWTCTPLIVSAPMLDIASPELAVAVSGAGGLGFIAAGFDLTHLDEKLVVTKTLLAETQSFTSRHDAILPIGLGFLNWGADLDVALAAIQKYPPAAVWLFAPKELCDLVRWSTEVGKVTNGRTKIWVQVGSVDEAVEVAKTVKPDVLVVQGSDAGGHGRQRAAGIVSLLPETKDALGEKGHKNIHLVAAGGIAEGRGVAAALVLGANGVVMGTRFLASQEANIARGYQNEIIRATDGGINTVRSKVYDTLRGMNDWPAVYGGRGIINQSYLDAREGYVDETNMELYAKALKTGDDGWGPRGRLTTYAGTAVGLIKDVKPAAEIVKEVRDQARLHLQSVNSLF